MYTTLVPTAGVREAEESANWEYIGDAQGLPPELTRIGITLGAFCDALFAVADNVRTKISPTCQRVAAEPPRIRKALQEQ